MTGASDAGRPVLYVMVGLPGAGKTTRARELAAEHRALRLTPDEWMIPLFGESEAGGKRDVLEGRFVWLAIEALRLGVNVVLDFGVWARDERCALRALAGEAGAECRLVYLPVTAAEQRGRIQQRWTSDRAATFAVTAEDLIRYGRLFQEPQADELRCEPADPPPDGHPSWRSWASDRWPTSVQ